MTSRYSSATPAPIATQSSGFSATWHGDARLLREQHVEVAQQRAAARQHDAAVDDVRRQSGGVRSSTLRTTETIVAERVLDRRRDVARRDGDRLRQAADLVAAADLHLQFVVASGTAAPIVVFISSAVRSPISRL